jgi:type I site-specific restriction endonuclease
MHHSNKTDPVTKLFGEVISTYTRAQALEDGVLVDAGAMAHEADFKWPVAITARGLVRLCGLERRR